MPWRVDTPLAAEDHDLKMDFIEVKGAREELEVQGDLDTSDSETSFLALHRFHL